jgi:hypothetical protein
LNTKRFDGRIAPPHRRAFRDTPQEPEALVSTWRPFRIEVATADIDVALAIAARFGESPRVEQAGDSAYLVLANPEGVDGTSIRSRGSCSPSSWPRRGVRSAAL